MFLLIFSEKENKNNHYSDIKKNANIYNDLISRLKNDCIVSLGATGLDIKYNSVIY